MKRILLQTLAVLTVIVFVSSCQYKFIVEPEVPPPDPEDTISFAQEIVPIFQEQGCTGCHNTGGTPPDLSADNAYNSIISLGLVDADSAENSRIYTYPHPDGNHYNKYTSAQAALVLQWIEQGAQDN
jgi:hypothetical protein